MLVLVSPNQILVSRLFKKSQRLKCADTVSQAWILYDYNPQLAEMVTIIY